MRQASQAAASAARARAPRGPAANGDPGHQPGHEVGAVALLGQILDDLARSERADGAAADFGAAPEPQPPTRSSDRPAGAANGPTASLGEVIERLDERAFGFLILLLALPCCLPFVYVLPQIVSLPMMALAGQMAAGRHEPWLPARLRARRFVIHDFRSVLDRSARFVGWIERFAKPRLEWVTSHAGARIVGLLLIVPTASIMTPLPSTNTVPGIGVAIASLGLIERDGLLVILGLLIGFVWVGLLLFFGLEAASFIKDLVLSRI